MRSSVAWRAGVASLVRVREVADPKCRCAGASRPRWTEVSPRGALPDPRSRPCRRRHAASGTARRRSLSSGSTSLHGAGCQEQSARASRPPLVTSTPGALTRRPRPLRPQASRPRPALRSIAPPGQPRPRHAPPLPEHRSELRREPAFPPATKTTSGRTHGPRGLSRGRGAFLRTHPQGRQLDAIATCDVCGATRRHGDRRERNP